MRAPLLLLIPLLGCRPAPAPEPTPTEAPAAGGSEDIDSVGDRGYPIPFGVALDLAPGEAELLYPNLLAGAASPEALAAALPEAAAGLRRMEVQAGVQEDSQSAWVGAMGTYRGPGGKVTLLVQDTGWEPSTVNQYLAVWRVATTTLPDGRPVSGLQPAERGGLFAQVPVDPTRPRIVLQAHANEGVDRELVLAVLADVDLGPLKALLEGTRPFPVSPLLPADRSALADPAVLAKALPAMEGWREVSSGHGWHREQRRDVVAVAMKTYLRDDGVLQLSLRDLGLPGAGLTVGAKGDLEGSADEIRQGARGDVRCELAAGSCKAVEMIADRYAWSVVGPPDRGAVEGAATALDRAQLP